VTESELVAEAQRRVAHRTRTTAPDLSSRLWKIPPRLRTELPPPATPDAIQSAEDLLGFRFPPLLGRLWTEVANGGFGPGYGLYGLKGGFGDQFQGLTIVDNYLERFDEVCWIDIAGEPWPAKLVEICEWGCNHESAVDCSTPEGEIVDLLEGIERRRTGMTFAQWIEGWVKGVKLSEVSFGVPLFYTDHHD
jgi:hypothetical protein